MQITGGRVVFARSVQPAQYETKKAEVEITFTLAEGEELGTTLDRAGEVAQAKALELVGLQKPKTEPKSMTAVVDGVSVRVPPVTTAKAERTKADLEREQTEKLNTKVKDEKIAKLPKTPPAARPDPAAVEEEAKPQISTGAERVDPAAVGDPDDGLGDLLGDQPVVSDADLTSAIGQHNAKIKNPIAIKALVTKHGGGNPPQVRAIPRANRNTFLEELKKL